MSVQRYNKHIAIAICLQSRESRPWRCNRSNKFYKFQKQVLQVVYYQGYLHFLNEHFTPFISFLKKKVRVSVSSVLYCTYDVAIATSAPS